MIRFIEALLRRKRMLIEISGQTSEWEEYELPLYGQAVIELLQDVLGKGFSFRFRAKGSSMYPFIKDGDVIIVSPLRESFPGFGQVVAFIRPEAESVFIHRVVGKEGDSYLLKDDNVPAVTILVPKENILGRVTRVERNTKKVFLGLGPDRVLIAFLSKRGLLLRLHRRVQRLVHLVIQ